MGNHEVNLLHDRELPSGNRYLELPWAASHPRSYAEWLPAELRTENTTRAFALLQSALLQVYEQNLFRSVMVVTSGKRSVLRLVPAEHRAMVKAELARAQAAYLNAVSSGSVYGDWLEARPLTAVLADTLFVHGGVPASLAGAGGSLRTRADLAALNGAFSQASASARAWRRRPSRTSSSSTAGSTATAARWRRSRAFNVSRIAVGHTPGDSVRVECGGEFLALDSALGRRFRASGSNYCESELVSATAGYACPRVSDACEGKICASGATATSGASTLWTATRRRTASSCDVLQSLDPDIDCQSLSRSSDSWSETAPPAPAPGASTPNSASVRARSGPERAAPTASAPINEWHSAPSR